MNSNEHNNGQGGTPVIVANANAWKAGLKHKAEAFISGQVVEAVRAGSQVEAAFLRKLETAQGELGTVAMTRDALADVLERGLWIDFVEVQNLADQMLLEAMHVENSLLRKVWDSFEQGGDNKTVVIAPDGLQRLVDFSGEKAETFHGKARGFDESRLALLDGDPARQINIRPISEIAKISTSYVHGKSPQETTRLIDENLQALVRYLEMKVRGRTKVAAQEITKIKDILAKIHEHLSKPGKNADARVIQYVQNAFVQFRMALAKLMHHLREHLSPQAGVFVRHISMDEKLRSLKPEYLDLQRRLSAYKMAGFMERRRMEHPDPDGRRVLNLDRGMKALRERIRLGDALLTADPDMVF